MSDMSCHGDLSWYVSDCTVPITHDIQDIMTYCLTGHIDKICETMHMV